ncbi:MAG: sigma-70 family RNA polymerase sigma factor [Sporocytophaga sp.]|uniref:RNA polymerase sigma factor n=1 Tax=Sporocytophaga sp. TaxID=2231183 RepID=UPI001B05B57E|nr:sigma-70 family RNA polymerase sigma factor [Sporocytophaga sp.]MBO9703629.1 sigma-70 family RNA polymerase sigma factor [Sporocytophaga sp.]
MSEISILKVSQERQLLFMGLYKKAFPAVARYISRKGGNYEEAKDIFQDALIIYYEKLVTKSFAPVKNEKAYILGIAKHLWCRRLESNVVNDTIDNAASETVIEEDNLLTDKLMHLLETAGQKCMEILSAFYYDKASITDIAQQFGYSGTRSATVQKYKCIEKIRETVKEKSLAYEDFVE